MGITKRVSVRRSYTSFHLLPPLTPSLAWCLWTHTHTHTHIDSFYPNTRRVVGEYICLALRRKHVPSLVQDRSAYPVTASASLFCGSESTVFAIKMYFNILWCILFTEILRTFLGRYSGHFQTNVLITRIQLWLTLNIPKGVLWGTQRVIFCDPAVTITTNLLLIFVCVPHQLKINIMQLDL